MATVEMEADTGVGVFLIPATEDPIVEASSEQAHLTTIWLGEMGDISDEELSAIREEVRAYSSTLDGPVVVPVTERGTLGDEGADVAFLESTESLVALRDGLIEASPTLSAVMERVEQFPEWTPHVTLGYPESPAAGEYDGDAVTFDQVGLWVGPEQEEFPMGSQKAPETESETALESLRARVSSFDMAAVIADVDDDVESDEMPTDELEDGEEEITEIPVHGVATVEGKATGDGRGFRPEALNLGAMPQPLGYEYTSTHGGTTSNVAIVGRIDSYDRKELEDGVVELRWRGVIMPGKEYGARAVESIIDGSYTGLSVIVDSVTMDTTEEREVMRARILAEREGRKDLVDEEIPAIVADEDFDVEEILDMMIGDGTQAVTWFSSARVRRFDMVPTGAFQEAYIALGHEFADEMTPEQIEAAATALEDCGCADSVNQAEAIVAAATGSAPGAKADGTPPKCHYGDEPATQYVLHSEGMAYVPTCDEHLEQAKADAAESTPDGDPDESNIDRIGSYRTVSRDERDKLAEEGKALPDGSYPIANVEDLRNAIQSIGRASDPEKAHAHIKKRARELDQEDLIPEDWDAQVDALVAAGFAPGTKDGPGWITHPIPTSRIRRYWVRGAGAAKIKWGVPGDFNRCRAQLVKYVQNPEWLAGLCANMHKEAIGVWPGQEGGGRGHSLAASGQEKTPAPLVVMAGASTRAVYPAAAFAAPREGRAFALRVDREARTIVGYAAQWGVCHIGIAGMCQEAPRSSTDYSYFRKGVVDTDAGEQRVGLITAGIGHAGERVSAAAATAHYDQTQAVRAYINIGEDQHGIWYAGVIPENVTDAQIDELRAIGRVSGDWRSWSGVRGDLEMVGLVSVNTEGYQLAASGGVQTAAIGIGALDKEEPVLASGSSLSTVEATVLEADAYILNAEEIAGIATAAAEQVLHTQKREAMLADVAPARSALAARVLAGARSKISNLTKE